MLHAGSYFPGNLKLIRRADKDYVRVQGVNKQIAQRGKAFRGPPFGSAVRRARAQGNQRSIRDNASSLKSISGFLTAAFTDLQVEDRLVSRDAGLTVQTRLQFRNNIEIIEDFMFNASPGRGIKRMRQKETPRIRSVANSSRYSRQSRDSGGFERILEKHTEIEASPSPGRSMLQHGGKRATPAIKRQEVVYKVCVGKDSVRPRASCQRNMGFRQYATKLAQSRNHHYRVANPVCSTHDDTLNAFYF
jgi:hypothetical protein